MRKGIVWFRIDRKRLTERNPNPYNSESYYLPGLVLLYQGKTEEAYDSFYKAAWSNEQQEMSFYYLAAIDARNKKYARAYEHIEKALVKNAHNIKARGLKLIYSANWEKKNSQRPGSQKI